MARNRPKTAGIRAAPQDMAEELNLDFVDNSEEKEQVLSNQNDDDGAFGNIEDLIGGIEIDFNETERSDAKKDAKMFHSTQKINLKEIKKQKANESDDDFGSSSEEDEEKVQAQIEQQMKLDK